MVVQAFEYEKLHLLSREEAEEKAKSDDAAEPAAKKAKVDDNTQASTNNDARTDVYSEPLRGFFKTTNAAIKTPLFRRMDAELRERREEFLKGKGWEVSKEERQLPLEQK
jgi:hypothetical protein